VFGGEGSSRVVWVSTLDVHGWGSPTAEQDVAIDNVRRFAALGGTVVYGTDLGNGPLPLGVNPRELQALAAAGLGRDALLAALAHDAAPERGAHGGAMHADVHLSSAGAALATWIPGDAPGDPADHDALAAWLARAVVVERPDPAHAPHAPRSLEDRP
jgi:hypothetical protein